MALFIILILAGSALLALGANRFIAGAIAISKNFGIPTLIVGIVLVGFMTSLPEMLVSSMAAWQGNPEIGVGNAIGSNIANIGLVLGITAIIKPLSVHSKLLKREIPVSFLAMLFAWGLISNNYLSRLDGVLLLGGISLVVIWMLRLAKVAKQQNHDTIEQDEMLGVVDCPLDAVEDIVHRSRREHKVVIRWNHH